MDVPISTPFSTAPLSSPSLSSSGFERFQNLPPADVVLAEVWHNFTTVHCKAREGKESRGVCAGASGFPVRCAASETDQTRVPNPI